MSQEQIETITVDVLWEKVAARRQQGQRLVQISATRLPEHVELTYSFDLDRVLTNLRLLLPGQDTHLPSISTIYGCAILYENEIHDLFNVQVDGLTVDFKGNFMKTSVKFPFGSVKASAVVAAATPVKAAAAAPVTLAPAAPAANPAPTASA
ncbi:MAG: NADH-quinone oxidoreductase subunit C [Lacunisphaera sp.]|nr:NADH-quinone oxidoreductase subunit C [Lacunisphaera sp.]